MVIGRDGRRARAAVDAGVDVDGVELQERRARPAAGSPANTRAVTAAARAIVFGVKTRSTGAGGSHICHLGGWGMVGVAAAQV